jgi:hypothetical protein
MEISTFTAPKIALKVGVSSQLQDKHLESSIAIEHALPNKIYQWPSHGINSY